MGLEVFRNSEQGAGFVVAVVTIPICTLAVVLRFVATVKARRSIGIENWFALIALLAFIAFTCIFLYLITVLNGDSLLEFFKKATPEELERLLKVGWGMSPQFCVNQLFTKLSLLFLYKRIFGVHVVFRRCLYFLGVLQILWFIATYTTKYFMCSPTAYSWNKAIPGGTCINTGAFLAATESINSGVDFAMIGLAVWIVQSLQMDKATKIKLSFLFVLGGFSGVIGVIKIGEAYTAAYNNILDPLWDIIQMACSIVCCCAPIYRSLFIDTHFFQSIKSILGSTLLGSSRGSASRTEVSDNSTKDKDGSWMPLSGASKEHVTRTNVSAGTYTSDLKSNGGKGYLDEDDQTFLRTNASNSSYAMQTLEVRQDVDYV